MAIAAVLMIAFIANAAPAFVFETLRLRPLALSLDGGRRLFGRRVFGSHKTLGGAILALYAAGIAAENLYSIELRYGIPFGAVDAFGEAWGPAMFRAFALGVGVVGGDLVGSFVKRRIGLGEGQQGYVLDWGDWIAGALVAAALSGIAFPSWPVVGGVAFGFLMLQAVCDFAARRLGVRRSQ